MCISYHQWQKSYSFEQCNIILYRILRNLSTSVPLVGIVISINLTRSNRRNISEGIRFPSRQDLFLGISPTIPCSLLNVRDRKERRRKHKRAVEKDASGRMKNEVHWQRQQQRRGKRRISWLSCHSISLHRTCPSTWESPLSLNVMPKKNDGPHAG